MENRRRKSSFERPSRSAWFWTCLVMPALLASASSRPKRAAAPAILRQSASSATSPWTISTSAPAARTRSAVASASLRLLVQLRITALAPRLAAPTAMAAPRPVAPPVTRITLPSKSAIAVSLPLARAPLRRRLHHLACVGENPGVVEGEISLAPVCHPLRRGGVVAGPGPAARPLGKEHGRAGVPAWVALGIRVDADKAEATGDQPGLLGQLAPAGVLHRLADIDEAAGQGVVPLVRRVLALN